MNRISKTMRKGFTLVELMVVMAIMSILLLAVMSMTTPTSRMFRRTAVSDNVYSAADNMTGYLQRKLEYADNVWLLDSSVDEAGDLKALASAFKECYYKNVIKGTGTSSATDCKFVSGKVHVLELDNSTGKIFETVYKFDASNNPTLSAIKDSNGIERVEVLNPNYFSGDYANYYFRYILGATTLEAATNSTGERKMVGSEIVYCAKSEKDGSTVGGNLTNQAVTLVACKGDDEPKKPAGESYYEFIGPTVATVANLPFTNISSRKNGNSPVARLVVPGSTITADIYSQTDITNIPAAYQVGYKRANNEIVKNSFYNFASGNKVSFDNNIIFVFSYADELQ